MVDAPAAASTAVPATIDRKVRITVVSPFTSRRGEARSGNCPGSQRRLSGRSLTERASFLLSPTGTGTDLRREGELSTDLRAIGTWCRSRTLQRLHIREGSR